MWIYIISTILVLIIGRRLYRELNRGVNFYKPTADKHVLITGATSGIGLAVAKRLFDLGFSVIATCYDKREFGYEQLDQLSKSSSDTTKNRMHLIELDVSRHESILSARNAVEQILASTKSGSPKKPILWAVINNAGVGMKSPLCCLPYNQMERVIKINLLGPLSVAREFFPLLIESKGRIVNVSSILTCLTPLQTTTYCASKSGLLHASRILNKESRQFGVRTIVLLPAFYIEHTNIMTMRARDWRDQWLAMDDTRRKLFAHYFKIPLQQIESHLNLVWDESGKQFKAVNGTIETEREFRNTSMKGTNIEQPFVRALTDRNPASRVAVGKWWERLIYELPDFVASYATRAIDRPLPKRQQSS